MNNSNISDMDTPHSYHSYEENASRDWYTTFNTTFNDEMKNCKLSK